MQNFLIDAHSSAREALRQLDRLGIAAPVLFIQNDEKKIIGSLTDGDIRRGLLQELGIEDSVQAFMRKNFKSFSENNFSKNDIQELRKLNIRFVPILDKNGFAKSILDTSQTRASIPVSAVIMAGGRGERLMPLTEKTPKPMLKVGNKPIIEYNIDHLLRFGVRDITISIKYLGEQIQAYFGDGSDRNAKIQYINEDKPLGTIGALRQVSQTDHEYILVMNSDLLTDIDFEQFFESFMNEEADMAVASVPYDVNIPYAVLEMENGNLVKNFREKPKYTFYSNAGIYLFKKELIDLIPANEKFDATDLMNDVIASNRKLIAEPILGYWLDIGRIEDFYKAQEDIKHLKF